MNNQQANKKNMFNKLLIFFAANGATWLTFTRLKDAVTAFISINTDIDKAVQAQTLNIKGVALDKKKFRKAMAVILVKFARKARVYAHDINNNTLEELFNIHKEDFLTGKETVARDKAQGILDAINNHIGPLAAYNILPANVTAIGAAIKNFADTLGTPGEAEGETEAGTTDLAKLFEDADTQLDIIDDLLITEYEEDEPNLVEQYRNNRKIDNIGVHHTGLRVHVAYTNNGLDAEGIKMRIVELDKESTSDILGLVEIIKCKAGTYHVEFSGSNVSTRTLVITIKRGEILSMAVQVTINIFPPPPPMP